MRGFDSHGKTGTECAGVIFDHHRQIELFTTFVSQTKTHDATAVTNGQRHLFNGHGFSGENHIAFVFTVFVIENHHTAMFTECGQCKLYTIGRGAKSGK
ncbi:hypothetical protein D3C71_1353890 [compost metagenome]